MSRNAHRLFCAAVGLALMAGTGLARASSHSEAPGTAKDRLGDDTDLWAWVAPDAPDAVTIVGGWVPLLEPAGGPNFYSFDDEASYYVNIDNVGDALDHVRYRFRFQTTRRTGGTFLYNTGVVTSLDDPDLNVRQTYTLTREDDGVETVLVAGAPVAPQYVGPVSMPDYDSLAQAAITTLSDGTKVFVGPRDDPFFVDLGAIFDLLTIRRVPGNKGKGSDDVAGFNVMVIALQIPKTRLTADGAAPTDDTAVLGIYDSVERPMNRTLNGDGTVTTSGPEVQVSRLGHPLVNEVVIALQDKDRFNATKPTGDGAFLSYVTNPELPVLFNLVYGLPIPTTPRNDLVTVFLTGIPGLNKPTNPNQVPCEMLRLNMTIPPARRPKRLGVLDGDLAGFPNGRRLTDDVVDIEERAAAGGYAFTPDFNRPPANQLGDGVDFNDVPMLPYFPYAAPPHSPFEHDHHDLQRRGGHGRFSEGDRGDDDGNSPSSAIGGTETSLLKMAGPNPGSEALLEYTVATPGPVSLRIYDVRGREVRTLVDQDAAAGTFRAVWDGRASDGLTAARGVYFARFTASGHASAPKKIVLQ